jgi:hypothetical protein
MTIVGLASKAVAGSFAILPVLSHHWRSHGEPGPLMMIGLRCWPGAAPIGPLLGEARVWSRFGAMNLITLWPGLMEKPKRKGVKA